MTGQTFSKALFALIQVKLNRVTGSYKIQSFILNTLTLQFLSVPV